MSIEKKIIDLFHENLKFFLNIRGMSQADLARALKVSKTQVGRILSGTSAPTLTTLAALSNVLKIPPHFLLLIDDETDGEDWVGEAVSTDTIEALKKALLEFKTAKLMHSTDIAGASKRKK